jgi:hypothetical protein
MALRSNSIANMRSALQIVKKEEQEEQQHQQQQQQHEDKKQQNNLNIERGENASNGKVLKFVKVSFPNLPYNMGQIYLPYTKELEETINGWNFEDRMLGLSLYDESEKMEADISAFIFRRRIERLTEVFLECLSHSKMNEKTASESLVEK